MKTNGILLDVDSIQENEKSVIRLFVKTEKGIEIFKDKNFYPYFYVKATNKKKAMQEIMKKEFKGKEQTAKAVKTEEGIDDSIKVYFNNTNDLVLARETIKEIPEIKEKREYGLIFTLRYLIDKGLEPLNGIEITSENNEINSVKKIEPPKTEFNFLTFDLETYSEKKFSDPSKDPILMAAVTTKKTEIITTKKGKNVILVENEKEIIEKLKEKIKENKTDILITYNGDSFDLPYVKERARKLKTRFDIGTDNSEPIIRKAGLFNSAKIKGIQHLDAYQLVKILARFGIINSIKYDLETVINSLYGIKKEKIQAKEITNIWNTGKNFEKLLEYNYEDSMYTHKIALDYLTLLIELAKITKQTLFEVNRSSASRMVENLLINKSFKEKILFPNKPNEETIKQRMMNSLKGGFVREPIAGLHENLAILDFRSLHPSIMISHNISPETINCKCCKNGKHVSPEGDWFCENKQGFLPAIQKE